MIWIMMEKYVIQIIKQKNTNKLYRLYFDFIMESPLLPRYGGGGGGVMKISIVSSRTVGTWLGLYSAAFLVMALAIRVGNPYR